MKVFPPALLALDRVDLAIREGEIHSVIGENGAGKSTLMHVLYGMQPANGGRVILRGQEADFSTPREAVKAGIGMLHQEFMLIPSYTVYENVILGALDRRKAREKVSGLIEEYRAEPRSRGAGGGAFGGGSAEKGRMKHLLSRKAGRALTGEVIREFGVAAPSPRVPIGTLSGGNQQKIIIGREASLNSRFLLLDQPTRGLDVGSIEYIRKRIIQLRNRGTACLLISADLEELFALSDRLLVLHRGAVVAELNPEKTTIEEVGGYMLGLGKSDSGGGSGVTMKGDSERGIGGDSGVKTE